MLMYSSLPSVCVNPCVMVNAELTHESAMALPVDPSHAEDEDFGLLFSSSAISLSLSDLSLQHLLSHIACSLWLYGKTFLRNL